MNESILSEFLVKAKINTYATGGEGNEKILSDGCRGLVYEEGELNYKDKYYGFNPFSGQEIVFENEKAVWSMNYYGKIISDLISSEEIYKFLKEALKKVQKEKPFRGPDNLKIGDFEYINKFEGTIEIFKGSEEIFYQGKKVYELSYFGGFVK